MCFKSLYTTSSQKEARSLYMDPNGEVSGPRLLYLFLFGYNVLQNKII